MIPNLNNLTTFVVNASPKNEVCYFATMFNTSMVAKYLVVSLPKMYSDIEIEKITEVGSGIDENDISSYAITAKGRHWLDIPSERLNITAGYHLYEITFNDSVTSIECTLYFAYNIQDDNVEQPYNYMQPIRDAQKNAEEDSSDDTDDEEGDG